MLNFSKLSFVWITFIDQLHCNEKWYSWCLYVYFV